MTTIGWAIAMGLAGLSDAPDSHRSPDTAWQHTLDHTPFRFANEEASILFSLGQYTGDPEVHMVYHPRKGRRSLELRFVRDDKVILVLAGHTYSAFRTDRNILYFAHFWPSSTGCELAAYDLVTGQQLWRTKLKGIDGAMHSAYFNRVTVELGDGAVFVQGHETFGDYTEVVDKKSGKVLAHRVYRRDRGGSDETK